MKNLLLFIVMLSIFTIQTAFAVTSGESGTDVKPPPNVQTPAKATEITLWDMTYYWQQYYSIITCTTPTPSSLNGTFNTIYINMPNLNYQLICPAGYAQVYEARFAQALPVEITNEVTSYEGGNIQGGQSVKYQFYCKVFSPTGSTSTVQFGVAGGSSAPDIHVKVYCLLR